MKIRSILTAGAIAATTVASPAFADTLKGSYVGPGIAVGTDGQGAAASILGRVELGTLPLSVRPQLTITNAVEGAIGATYDVGVAENTNLYLGGGVGFGDAGIITLHDDTVGYVQFGAETQLAENSVIFADLKVALTEGTSVVPTVGLAWRF